jgi:hypothetical protein
MKERVEGWTSMLEERIDSELESRGAKLEKAEDDEISIRRRVQKRLKARNELASHIMIYLGVNGMLLFMWATFAGGIGSFPWPLFPIFFWGIGVVSQIGEYYTKYGAGARRREAELEREVQREMERSTAGKAKNASPATDKAKRRLSVDELDEVPGARVRLNEDGELSDSFVQERDEQEARRSRR